MDFASLGSGSKGNATLVRHEDTCLMVDCGFSVAQTERRLARLGLAPADLTAILVTHEHSDHLGGVPKFAAKFDIPVFMTAGTAAHAQAKGLHSPNLLRLEETLVIGDLEILPVHVPHDAREPAQYVFTDGARRFGVLTDVGRLTPHIADIYTGLDAFLLEANHDHDMLFGGPYPPSLKQRVGGGLGHLSNGQSADLLAMIDTSKLQHIVAAHLSENNNTPGHARAALAGALGCEESWIAIASQYGGLDWRNIR
ncbi:MAG: MBL fold metallo-hydrolase [Gammaproteobacteria bacterium]|nr:MBL fold metallo-hydrolase [Gammaproteobacteria bacterium]